ncbi:MAG: hypothetical protein JWN88_988 [Frankiales bacterium]|nr:hypothetical protein [Frankiales bacterium]
MSRPDTAASAAPAAAPAAAAPVCCGRAMSTISVTDAVTELALLSCSSCSRHAWLKDGELLDREGMLSAVRQRIAEVPRPRGGRPKGSGKKAVPAARTPEPTAVDVAAAQRARDMRSMLSGFRVLGE